MRNFFIVFMLVFFSLEFAWAEQLEYKCQTGQIVKINYNSQPDSVETKIELNYKNAKSILDYEESLLSSDYTIYAGEKYQWWEFMNNDKETGILFESQEDGDILEKCTINN